MAAQLNLRQQTGSSAPQQQQQQGPASDPVRPFDYKDLYPLVSDFANTSVQQHTVSEKQERVDKAMNLKADYANYPHRNPALNVRIDHDIEQLKSERDAATMDWLA
ncbi:hypothetical protein BC936DRAFT_146767 [Jimgerdemannia flammicorona]|uniref:Uncharacterized protein n=1 Tax=Jimgerdemannia flammicorona TaxID=994334 RepID=A0A433D6W1_9FUNG|nr:hypothetical protein BC936DRAFT_146767 [Jimgerdemannia flammicorona]